MNACMQNYRIVSSFILSMACLAAVALFGFPRPAFSEPPEIEITQWKNNKSGAISLTFDDGYEAQYSIGVAALNDFGFKGTFFVVTEFATSCSSRYVCWDNWRNAASAGHEIGSHSRTHPHSNDISAPELEAEIFGSQAEIERQLTSQECLVYAYPYGEFDETARAMVESAYIGARGAGPGLNYAPFDFYDARVWFPESVDGSLEYQADLAELSGAWMIAGFHGLDGTEYGPVTEQEFREFLNHISTKNLWVDSFGAVTRYIRERESAAISVVSITSDAMLLSLTDSLDDSLYGEELTIRSEAPANCVSAVVTQDGRATTISSVWEGSTNAIYFNAIPDRGQITVAFLTEPTELSLSGLVVTPAVVEGGSPAQGVVVLSGPAPSGGTLVALSDNSTAAVVPASVTVPAGSSSAAFPITTSSVADSTDVVISAGYNGETRTATLTVEPAGNAQVMGFTLVNAATDEDAGPLVNGDVVNLAVTGTSLNIRADVSGAVGSVRFAFDGNPDFRLENAAPYALAGDNSGDYATWTPALGSHRLTATPYSAQGGGGTAGIALAIDFTVTNTIPNNQAPVITAGPQASPNPVMLLAITTVSVTASDADSDPLAYAWSQAAGPGIASFTNAAASSTAVAFSAAGSYNLRVAVSDGHDMVSGSLEVTVTSAPPIPDIDGDGDVDGSDLYVFMLAFGKLSSEPSFDARCDFDLSGDVDGADLGVFAGRYGN